MRRYSSLFLEDGDLERRRQLVKLSHGEFYPSLSRMSWVNNTSIKSLRIPKFREKFNLYQFPESKKLEELHVVNGRVQNIRKLGKGMLFIDVVQDFEKLQVVASNKALSLSPQEFKAAHEFLRIGDSVSCIGYPGVTNVGELSLKTLEPIHNLSPLLRLLPPKLTDLAKINGNRVVDYRVNSRSQDVIIARHVITSTLRSFLNELGFLETETPTVASAGTGANAKPFITTSSHVKDHEIGEATPLYLRVAPELWLKRLVISGFDKVYEIGKSFRNEGIDGTHNPEFTTCEFYQTFITLQDLMDITESIFMKILNTLIVNPRLNLTHEPCSQLLQLIAENNGHFQKLEFVPTIEAHTKEMLPSEFTVENLSSYFDKIGLEHPSIKSPPQYLDKLSSTFLEPLCKSLPTFIYNQPSVMSPLLKSDIVQYHGADYEISKRFELFIHGREYVNSYEEENDPFKQLKNFELQLQGKDLFKDDEAMIPDYRFVQTMEIGMSPTGGWGLGIDRLVMLLTGTPRIENVLTFGKINDVLRQ